MNEWPKVFPTFFNLSLNFCNKKLMNWATVSSRNWFFWPFRASSSEAAKNINYLISVIDQLVISMSRVFSCVVGSGCLLWPVHFLGKTLLAFALFYFVLLDQTYLLLQASLDFLLLHFSTLWWKNFFFFFFLVLVLEGLVGLHGTIHLQLAQH